MKEAMQFIREYTVWLHHPLFEFGLFYIDLWSLVHFWSGMILFTILTAGKCKNRWRWLFYSLFGFELVEAFIFISIMKMFRPEKLPDSFTDILIGFAGGYLILFLFEKIRISKDSSKLFLFLLTSATISFLWTGNNKFEFGNSIFNTPGINWCIFICWAVVGFAVLSMYSKLESLKLGNIKSLVIIWLLYLATLIILICGVVCVENAFESTSNFLNVFPLGRANFFFYVTSPVVFIGLYEAFDALFRRYFSKLNLYEST